MEIESAFAENHKIMIKETEEDRNRCNDILCS
jgi:hypothetical protein